MFKQLQALVRDDSGTATVEYSLVVALFGVTIISAFQVVLNESGSQLSNTQSHLQTTALTLPAPLPSTSP